MSEAIETTAPVEAVAEVSEPVTVEDTLSRVYDEVNPDEAAPADDAPALEGQTRGPDGKFVAADKPEGAEPEPEAPNPDNPANPEPVASAMPTYLEPFKADFEMRGLSPEVGVPRLLQTWKALESNPPATLEWLAAQYGLKAQFSRMGEAAPAQQAQTQAQPAADEWEDPAVKALRMEVAELRTWREEQQRQTQEEREAAYNHALQSVTTEINTFLSGKAKADGIDPSILRPTMGALISSWEAETLDEAYERAVWSHPQTRTVKEAALRKQAEDELSRKNAEALQAARRAGGVIVRSDTATPAAPRTVEESLSRAYDAAQRA